MLGLAMPTHETWFMWCGTPWGSEASETVTELGVLNLKSPVGSVCHSIHCGLEVWMGVQQPGLAATQPRSDKACTLILWISPPDWTCCTQVHLVGNPH